MSTINIFVFEKTDEKRNQRTFQEGVRTFFSLTTFSIFMNRGFFICVFLFLMVLALQLLFFLFIYQDLWLLWCTRVIIISTGLIVKKIFKLSHNFLQSIIYHNNTNNRSLGDHNRHKQEREQWKEINRHLSISMDVTQYMYQLSVNVIQTISFV